MRARLESDVSLLIFFPASPCRIVHIASTHDYLLNEWMDGPIQGKLNVSLVLY